MLGPLLTFINCCILFRVAVDPASILGILRCGNKLWLGWQVIAEHNAHTPLYTPSHPEAIYCVSKLCSNLNMQYINNRMPNTDWKQSRNIFCLLTIQNIRYLINVYNRQISLLTALENESYNECYTTHTSIKKYDDLRSIATSLAFQWCCIYSLGTSHHCSIDCHFNSTFII